MDELGYMPGERRKPGNVYRRRFHSKIEKLPEDKAFFVVLGKDCTPINASPLCKKTSDDDAMEILKLHGHHHCGDSIHRFETTEDLSKNLNF